jgi:hypothetical protein
MPKPSTGLDNAARAPKLGHREGELARRNAEPPPLQATEIDKRQHSPKTQGGMTLGAERGLP